MSLGSLRIWGRWVLHICYESDLEALYEIYRLIKINQGSTVLGNIKPYNTKEKQSDILNYIFFSIYIKYIYTYVYTYIELPL